MATVIAVTSGKGGTGKTSLTGAVSSCLAALGHRTLCIDMDVGLRNLDLSLGLADRALMDFTDVLQGRCPLERAAVEHPDIQGLFLLTAPLTLPEGLTEAAMRDLLRQAKEQYDYILLDAPAGLGPGFRLAVCGCDRAVVVSTSDASALRDAQRTVSEIGSRVERIHLVVNRVQPKLLRRLHTTIDDAMEKYGSDKPDLRIDLTVSDATGLLSDCGFEPFAGNTVKAVVVSDFAGTRKQIDKLCADVEVQAGNKAYWFRLDENGELVGGISKFLQEKKEAVIDVLSLTPGCFVGLSAGKLGAAQKTAGVLVKTMVLFVLHAVFILIAQFFIKLVGGEGCGDHHARSALKGGVSFQRDHHLPAEALPLQVGANVNRADLKRVWPVLRGGHRPAGGQLAIPMAYIKVTVGTVCKSGQFGGTVALDILPEVGFLIVSDVDFQHDLLDQFHHLRVLCPSDGPNHKSIHGLPVPPFG